MAVRQSYLRQPSAQFDVAKWFLDAHPVSAAGRAGDDKRWQTADLRSSFRRIRHPTHVVVNSQCGQSRHQTRVREEIRGHERDSCTRTARAGDYKGNTLWTYERWWAGKPDPIPIQVEHNELHGFIRDNRR